MKRPILAAVALIAFAVVQPRAAAPPAAARHVPTMTQFMSFCVPAWSWSRRRRPTASPGSPTTRGMRNVFTAAAPDFKPVRVTAYLKDDGVDTTQLSISDDGTTVAFTRGTRAQPRATGSPAPRPTRSGVERAIWAAKTTAPGVSWRLAEGSEGVLSPDGRYVAYAKDGQIYPRVDGAGTARPTTSTRASSRTIRIWGVNGTPVWSPDGRKLAFVSRRTDHSFIAIYDRRDAQGDLHVAERGLRHEPDLVARQQADRVHPPARHPLRAAVADGHRRAGQSGGTGVQRGERLAQRTRRRGTRRWRRWRTRRTAAAAIRRTAAAPNAAGATAGPDERDVQRRLQPVVLGRRRGDRRRAGVLAQRAGGEGVQRHQHDHAGAATTSCSSSSPRSGRASTRCPCTRERSGCTIPARTAAPTYSVRSRRCHRRAGADSLTPQDGQIESSGFSPDGTFLYYGTNATDIERRHIWRVPVGRRRAGAAHQRRGDRARSGRAAVGQVSPCSAPTTTVRSRSAIFPAARHSAWTRRRRRCSIRSSRRNSRPTRTSNRRSSSPRRRRHRDPQPAVPAEGSPSRREASGDHLRARRPGAADAARVSLHGGLSPLLRREPVAREPGLRRAVGELSRRRRLRQVVPYRAEHQPRAATPSTRTSLAGGKYLQSRPDVDPKRVGIWGLSYGGLLTAQALARNSDIFVAGVDLAGVHLYGSNLDPENLAYKSSAISEIDQLEVAGAPDPGRRRPQRQLRADASASSSCCARTTCPTSSS